MCCEYRSGCEIPFFVAQSSELILLSTDGIMREAAVFKGYV